jgi:hypothetical protein
MLIKFMLHIAEEPLSRRWQKITNETANQIYNCICVNLDIA